MYRGLNYSIQKVVQKESKYTKCLQIIDVLLGIVVFLNEERYYEVETTIPIKTMNKVLEQVYLDKFSKFNIFLWGNEEVLDDYEFVAKEAKRYNISKYIAKFLDFKYKYDNEKRLEITKIYLTEGMKLNYTERDYKDKLGFGSNLKLLVRRYLCELDINQA